jgi:hypothetical protein
MQRDKVPAQAVGGEHSVMVRLVLAVQNNNPSTAPTKEYPVPNP